MTFPRRLTPSVGERSTVVQQRMAPGGALGVGSRHVRSSQQAPSGPSSGAGDGVIGSATYADPGTSTAFSYTANPTSLSTSDGDDSSIAYDASGPSPGIAMLEEGWYQVQAYAEVSGIAPTDTASMRLRWSTAGTDAWGVLANISGGGAMTATTAISRNFTAGGVVVVTIYNPAGGTINTINVVVTRLSP